MSPVLKTAMTALMLPVTIAMTAPASAGPAPSNLAALSTAAPQMVTNVHWRGGAVAAGIAAGVITGAIIAGSANPYYYGSRPYYYGGPSYYYGPRYYAPPPYYLDSPSYGARRYYYYPEPVYVAPPTYYAPRGVYHGPRGRCWITTDSHRGYGYWGGC